MPRPRVRGAAHAPRRRDARGVDGSWHMAVLFRCIESYGVVAPLEDDCHPCVQVIINLFAPRQESRRPTAASTTDLCATSVNIQTLAATTVAGSAVDALARARRRRRSPRLRASNRCASHDRVSTYASLPVVALAPTTRVRSISHLASPAGACLQVLTACRSAASRRASAAVRALREPTCLSIV